MSRNTLANANKQRDWRIYADACRELVVKTTEDEQALAVIFELLTQTSGLLRDVFRH